MLEREKTDYLCFSPVVKLKRTASDLDAEPARLKARAKHAISAGQAFALLLILSLIVEWLAPSDSEKANSEQAKAEIEAEYQDAQNTVLEDLAGSIRKASLIWPLFHAMAESFA